MIFDSLLDLGEMDIGVADLSSVLSTNVIDLEVFGRSIGGAANQLYMVFDCTEDVELRAGTPIYQFSICISAAVGITTPYTLCSSAMFGETATHASAVLPELGSRFVLPIPEFTSNQLLATGERLPTATGSYRYLGVWYFNRSADAAANDLTSGKYRIRIAKDVDNYPIHAASTST